MSFSKNTLNCILGPSGSGARLAKMAQTNPRLPPGKTILLDTIAYGASASWKRKFEGSVSIHGTRTAAAANRVGKISYLAHKERLLSIFTVRETLLCACQLMNGIKGEQGARQVNDIIEQLGLSVCADTMVSRLSGGQRRRCAVAVELINDRRDIIILDEPTSGLDAHIALELVKCFADLVAKGRTFVFTMHQPTSEIAALLPNIVILTSKGSLAFKGNKQDGLDFFASQGFAAPKSWNPLDFFVEVVGDDFENRIGPSDVEVLATAFSASAYNAARHDDAAVPLLMVADDANELEALHFNVSVGVQLYLLLKRCALVTWRNPGVLKVRTFTYILVSLFLGLVFLEIGQSYDDASILARNSVLFFVSSFYSFMSVVSLPQLISDRHVYMSEKRNGLFAPLPFVLAQSITTALVTFVVSLPAAVFVVNMARLQNMGVYLALLWLALFVADMFSAFVGTFAPNFLIGLLICCAYWSLGMMTEGYFITLDAIPPYFLWASWITPMSYSFESFMLNEYAPNATFVSYQFPYGWAVLDFFGFGTNGMFKWFDLYADVAILAAFAAGFIFLFYVSVRFAW